MKTMEEIAMIIDALDMDTYCALYEEDSVLKAVGLTREEFDIYCGQEDFPEGDVPEDWSDPVWED